MKLKLEHKAIPKGGTVIVGVSGGRDSMALVHALLNQRKDLKIVPVHVNHGLRPDADEDADFTEAMMMRWELPCEVTKPRPPEKGNIEEWGREKRYEIFEKMRKKYKADLILTAHQQDDDFESMMLHFIRGTRVKGLSGMPLLREHIYRPLLNTSRAEINEYVDANEIPFREDPTNQDETLSRNFLRHKIIPVLNHVYPGLAARWQTQKSYWEELQSLLETSARVFMEEFLDPREGLNRAAYKNLPFPVRATVLELWYRDTTGDRIKDSQTLERWDEAIRTWPSRKKTEWLGGTKATGPTKGSVAAKAASKATKTASKGAKTASKTAKFLVMSKERARVS